MFKIALASHGSLCRGMLETAKLFTQDVSFIQIFPFYEENPESDAEAQLDAWIEDIHEEDVVVMLTDILWGSVNQKIMLKLQNRTNVHIVTGLNLPLLLEMITMEPSRSPGTHIRKSKKLPRFDRIHAGSDRRISGRRRIGGFYGKSYDYDKREHHARSSDIHCRTRHADGEVQGRS